ncbi:MAG: SpoIIE family protein phosphatase [Chloroflexi bacterium]|nr:SpoIIE family protein phosphatase [Chloroflexota bacterium]
MRIEIAVAKVEKYAVGESGDTVEVVERPHGGVSIVLVDGQRSGKSAKAISNLVARKAIALLAEGVRDGAAARAAHDYLRAYRGGKVSAELIILSADLETGSMVVSRYTETPVLIHHQTEWSLLDAPAGRVGVHARTRPHIEEYPLRPGLWAVAVSDGVWSAGQRKGRPMNLLDVVQGLPPTLGAEALANDILAHALQSEQGRPNDDLTVVVMRISRHDGDNVRRMSMRLPIPPRIYNAWTQ